MLSFILKFVLIYSIVGCIFAFMIEQYVLAIPAWKKKYENRIFAFVHVSILGVLWPWFLYCYISTLIKILKQRKGKS